MYLNFEKYLNENKIVFFIEHMIYTGLAGLTHRTRLQAFARKYSFVSPRKLRAQEETGYEDCKVILETLMRKIDRSKSDVMFGSWVLGKRCVFYR